MKKYFIILKEEQKGPFTVEELSKYEINKNTPVWHEGLTEWTTIDNIEELKNLFPQEVTPPVYSNPSSNKKIITPPNFDNDLKFSSDTLMPKSKTNRNLIVGCIIVFLMSLIFLLTKDKFLKDKLNVNDEVIVIPKSGVDSTSVYIDSVSGIDYEAVAAENARIEQENASRQQEIAEKNEARIQEILVQMNNNHSTIQVYKNRLQEAKKFQLFRSSEERQNEINNILEDISIIENDNNELENEMITINPNWGSDT